MTNATELAAILHGAAFAPSSDNQNYGSIARAFLRITGPDATRWLNGMVTNNIKDLAPSEGNYNFLLNAQGRIQGDCTIYREPGGGDAAFLLETDKSQIETIHQILDKFIIMDDVELKKGVHIAGSQFDPDPMGLAVTGARAVDLITRIVEGRPGELFVAPQPNSFTYASLEGNKVIILTHSQSDIHTFEVWGPRGVYKELYRQIEFFETRKLSPETVEAYRILSATPRYGTDIRNTETNKDLPQETAQAHALHFSKGCYLGQEIVERIHSRGQVHRTFLQFTLTGKLPTLPAPLEANGKTVGELTSAAIIPLPEGDITLALGYARREALDRHEPLAYPGGIATPRPPK